MNRIVPREEIARFSGESYGRQFVNKSKALARYTWKGV